MIEYVAFLRGINVGGHKAVNMEALKKYLRRLDLRMSKRFWRAVMCFLKRRTRAKARLPNSRTVDLMSVLEKEFGRKVTTRNWNTINRILKAAKLDYEQTIEQGSRDL